MVLGVPPGATVSGAPPRRIAPSAERPAGSSAESGPCYDSAAPLQEDHPIDPTATIEANLGPVVAALAIAVVVLLVLVAWLVRRVSALDGRLRGITRGAEGASLEAVLDAHLDRVEGVARDVDDLSTRTSTLETKARGAFSRVGLVRFNPFEDTGGNQSFALALLDADGDGFVLSSLHARSGTRVYAKAITGGRADAALSEEETAAIRQARS